MSFTCFFFFFFSDFVILVGLEPINGFHESKNTAANDQLPSTEADQSITATVAATAAEAPTATTTIATPSPSPATTTTAASAQQQQQLPSPSQAAPQAEVTAAAVASVSTSATEISAIAPIPMDVDPMDAPPNIDLSTGVDSSDVPQVDLESDVLREFLESETTDLSAADDVGIEQMLMA